MKFNRAVIKVGSALIAPDNDGCTGKYILAIASFITECIKAGKEIILVSSGSVAAGRQLIQHSSPEPSIRTKQAMSSVGQMQMMANWQRFFDVPCSQILITHGDLKNRRRYINIKETLGILLENNIIPIVNENDTVVTKELKVGDNDNLAALVAGLSGADCLIILSDIDGLYDKNPKTNSDAIMLPEIEKITPEIYAMAGATNNPIATGGMKTKIQAAEKAIGNGIETYIINGTDNTVFDKLLNGENPGTRFAPNSDPATARKHWLEHTLKSNGNVVLDKGAINALVNEGASLLPSGIKSVSGKFSTGDTINIIDFESQKIVAKGICQYGYRDLSRIKGKNSDQIQSVLGFCTSEVVIHRNDMVLLSE